MGFDAPLRAAKALRADDPGFHPGLFSPTSYGRDGRPASREIFPGLKPARIRWVFYGG